MGSIALFDLDRTLLSIDSDSYWCRFVSSLADDPAGFRDRAEDFFRDYRNECLDLEAYLRFQWSFLRHLNREELLALRNDFASKIKGYIAPGGLVKLEEHKRRGDIVLIITATNSFVASAASESFEVDDILAVDLMESSNGVYDGRILGVPSFREGKVIRVDQWLLERGLRLGDFERSYFYSDSINDIYLLEVVTDPRVVNPDDELLSLACSRGWEVYNFY